MRESAGEVGSEPVSGVASYFHSCAAPRTQELIDRLIVQAAISQSLVHSAQDAIQLFAKLQELLSILFRRNERAEFMDAVTVGLIHRGAVLQPPPCSVCSMSNAGELLATSFGRNWALGSLFPQTLDVNMDQSSEVSKIFILLAKTDGGQCLRSQFTYAIIQATRHNRMRSRSGISRRPAFGWSIGQALSLASASTASSLSVVVPRSNPVDPVLAGFRPDDRVIRCRRRCTAGCFPRTRKSR
jgi:hypothetical protein